MALLDIFKKKKRLELPRKKGRPVKVEKPKPAERPKEAKAKEEKQETAQPRERTVFKAKGKGADFAWRVLKSPHVTEKAGDAVKTNQYVFKVFPGANKTEVKKAIEGLYNVEVAKVRILNTSGKEKRLGRVKGWRAGYKKAIVKLREGYTIEVLPR